MSSERPGSDHPATPQALPTAHSYTTIRLTHEGGRRFMDAIKYLPQPNDRLSNLVRENGGSQGN